MARPQIPTNNPIVDKDGKMSKTLYYYLSSMANQIGPSNSVAVQDGTASSFGPTVIYQGGDAVKPTPVKGYIYFSNDTGDLYTVNSQNNFQEQSPAYTGDVTKAAFSKVLSLPNINPTVGEFNTVTVNSKGQVISARNAVNSSIDAFFYASCWA